MRMRSIVGANELNEDGDTEPFQEIERSAKRALYA
jgi:hypothetical protein